MIDYVSPRGKSCTGVALDSAHNLNSGLTLPSFVPTRYEEGFRDQGRTMHGPHDTA